MRDQGLAVAKREQIILPPKLKLASRSAVSFPSGFPFGGFFSLWPVEDE